MKRARMNTKPVSVRSLLPVITSLIAPSIHAQEGRNSDGAGGAVSLDPVIVTANRRPQRLSEVGASLTSIDLASREARGIATGFDLQRLVPGLSVSDTGLNVPAYSIRGIGLYDQSLASNSTVTLSVDEVPLPYAAMAQGALLDLKRVEIVKGPQGTLYGLNSTGGAINYIANRPGETVELGGQVGFGRFNSNTMELFASGPVSDTLRARWSLNGARADGWQKSLSRDDTLGRTERAATRLMLSWDAADDLSLDLVANGWIDHSDSQAAQLVTFRAAVPANIPRLPDVFSSRVSPDDPRAADWNPARDYARDDSFAQLSAKATYRLNEHTNLQSISAWSRYNSHAFNDRDGIAPATAEFTTTAKLESVYQELRLIGTSRAVQWSLGANLRRDSTYDSQLADVSRSTNTFVGDLKLNQARLFSSQKIDSYAAFVDGEIALTPRVSMVAGGRYTRDRRTFTGSTCDDGSGDFAAVFTLLANSFRSGAGLAPIPDIAPGSCLTLSPLLFEPGLVKDELVEDNFSFRSGVTVRPTPTSLLSASFSRGFKAGTFPTLSAVSALSYAPATQERVDALEVGFRTSHLDQRLRVNGSVFHYDYRDKQFRGVIPDPRFGLLVRMLNIPKSTITGAELEVVASPLAGLTLDVGASYIKAEVSRYTGLNLLGSIEDFSGQTLPYTPPWSVNVGGQYDWAVGSQLGAFVGAGLAYRSRTSGFLGRDRPLDVDAYATLDLRVGLKSADGRWSATLWGTNVTNTHYWHSAAKLSGDTIVRYAARPAMYGVLLAFNH
jgi:iron complex outermembrane recepter protein